MFEEVWMVYKTDPWHSYASRDLLGVGTSKANAIELVNQQVKKEGETLSEDEAFNIQNINQTQGYSGEGEFHMEQVSVNTLL